ncbi:MAG TPA: hypothetical protein VLT33_39370, partial [Labilithrix sp.]|nr:hypothetical protein [Labilithrix sp.]
MGHAPFPTAAPTRRTLAFPSLERAPSARPSERPTLPTLPPVEEVIELSASALESEPRDLTRSLGGSEKGRAAARPVRWLRDLSEPRGLRLTHRLGAAALGAAAALLVVG